MNRKRYLIIAAASLFSTAVLLSGCGKKEAPKQEDLPKGVTVNGKQITVVYAENPTTGFEWSYSIDNEDVISYVSDSYKSDKKDKNITGSGGKRTFVFRAGASGAAVITLKYARSWETDGEQDIVNLSVTVKDDHITVK